jgi:hypothetical protein
MTRREIVHVLREAGEWLLCFACLYLTVAVMLAIAEMAR